MSNAGAEQLLKAMESCYYPIQPIILGDREFERLGKFIMGQYGIKMPPFKKTFLQSRLQKRLRELGMSDFKAYADFLFTPEGHNEELPKLINAVSTNKTDFFREPMHFDFLNERGLAALVEGSGKKCLSVWSAGCSSGEEPYTIAMILKEYSRTRTFFDFRLLATDISSSVLQQAADGIYDMDKVGQIPVFFRNQYLQKGKGNFEKMFRITPDIRQKIVFQYLNLLDRDYEGIGTFDIIFCRNVLIYFERELQYRILLQLCRHLAVGGLLFLGHSESITGLNLPLTQIKPTIFRRH